MFWKKQATKRECDKYIVVYVRSSAKYYTKNIYRAAKPAASVSVYEYIHVSYIFSFLLFLLEKPERSMASVTFPYLVIGCCTLWYCSPSRKKTYMVFIPQDLSIYCQSEMRKTLFFLSFCPFFWSFFGIVLSEWSYNNLWSVLKKFHRVQQRH